LSLNEGHRIGPYEISALIGVGGMGEVYRATDTNLKRQVAIKVLPAGVANDANRLARFQREAELLAALSHPNIAIIHGLEKGGGITALVMELVEGPTLADRIAEGALPIVEAIALAKQIAEALEAAHAQGIIHRDLKPANVKIRPDGTAKVLDFGLAKALEPIPPADIGAAPTITSPAMMTGVGVLLGTAAYMAPEQARGKSVDTRADIWAFGCVVYEMLTGRLAFPGDSVVDTLSAIVSRDPDWQRLPARTSSPVRRLVQRCLARDVNRRLHDIADARIELEDALNASEVPESGGRGRIGAGTATLLALACLGIGLTAGVLVTRSAHEGDTRPSPTVRYTIPIEGLAPASTPVISRDGRHIAVVGSKPGGPSAIWVLALDDDRPRELPGTSGASDPFWSPDGNSIGFFADGALKRVDLSGGSPQRIARAEEPLGAAWGSTGVIVFSARYALYQVPASGGTPALVASLDLSRQENSLRVPEFLPDGRRFFYSARSGRPENTSAYLASLDGGTPRRILSTRWPVRYVSPDLLIYVRDDALVAQSFDAARGSLTGMPRQIIGAIDPNLSGLDFYSVSDTGTLVYRLLQAGSSQLTWVDRDGTVGSALGQPSRTPNFRISPDEHRIVFDEASGGSRSIWTLDIATGARSRLTFPGSDDWQPVWSPDGLRVLFGSYRNGPIDMYLTSATGGGTPEAFMVSSIQKGPRDWSNDGRFVLYTQDSPEAKEDLYAREVANNATPIVIAASPAREFDGRFSSDGRWIAYVSNETGANEIYVQPFPPTGGKWQASTGGGLSPRWRADGRELFYVTPQGDMKVVSVSEGPAFAAGPPRTLFHLDGIRPGLPGTTSYEVSRDGRRFLVNLTKSDPPAPTISVILNWAASP
jgi:serine/threonine protein kinase/Tol biopolymer transport system component